MGIKGDTVKKNFYSKKANISKSFFLLVVLSFVSTPFVHASAVSSEAGYLETLGRDWVRGVTNIVSCPAELVVAMREANQSEGRPVLKHSKGLVDGIFRTVERAGAGLWDLPSAVIPGFQEGLPEKPETLKNS